MKNETFYCSKLFAVSSKGKPKEWIVFVCDNGDGTCTLVRKHGYVGQKIQKIEKIIRKGKNIGRSNETTYWSQAVADAKSLHQRQVDRGFVRNLKDWVEPEFPMLAHKFTARKDHIVYPCFVQRKFNGVRCFAKKVSETEMTYMSRSGKFYDTLEHLTPHFLESLHIGDIVDGEIYLHGITFQEIIRRVKKLRPESTTLEFHAYDFIPFGHAADPFVIRSFQLEALFLDEYDQIKVCKTIEVFKKEKIKQLHDKYVMEEFEGIMVRNKNGPYLFSDGKGPRSNNLLKYKEFFDEEFKIVGAVKADEGMHHGCVKFICETKSGETFTSYPKGTLTERRQMYLDRKKYIGKQLTVRYQELSESGTPVFNVGIAVRDYE